MIFVYLFTIWIGKISSKIVKLSGKGSGTALPGLLAERLPGNILKFFTDQIEHTIVVTGTNGKTTTQTLLSSILTEAQLNFISNDSGSNLKRGLISKLLSETNFLGKIKKDIAVFEIEEATLPKIIADLNPELLIVTNLFRDQLDAYGEIDRTQKFIRGAIEKVPDMKVILNADDPRVTNLTQNLKNPTTYYGISKEDIKEIRYEGFQQNEKTDVIRAQQIKVNSDLTTSFTVEEKSFTIQPTGKFHAYNALAAIIAAKEIKIKEEQIAKGLQNSKPAFGRGELIKKDALNYKFLLVKNPAGLNLTLDILRNTKDANVVLILNDKIADGRDVSWIWDAEMEKLNAINPKRIYCSGTRAQDMLLRIKYAMGLKKIDSNHYKTENGCEVKIEGNIENLHRIIQKDVKDDEFIFVLPTYTAMLNFRKAILGKAIL